MDMEQLCLHEPVSILHELDLGQHTVTMMSDGSIDLLANDAQMPSLADNGLSLDSDEMHRTVHLSARIGEVQDVDELVVRY